MQATFNLLSCSAAIIYVKGPWPSTPIQLFIIGVGNELRLQYRRFFGPSGARKRFAETVLGCPDLVQRCLK